jgi:uncharacterized membrane-anchored protein YhcB (DUF1043 family)
MFNRKKKNEQFPTDEAIAEELKKSEDRLDESRRELIEAHRTASVLHQIREKNHIVHDLREVFGGR